MNFDELRQKHNSAYWQIKKMNFESLKFFCESHDLDIVINPVVDLKDAHKYISYKFLQKICALNAIDMPIKWRAKLSEAAELYKGSTSSIIKDKPAGARGSRAAIIKRMLLANAMKSEIITAVAEKFPEIPLSSIGCQISATKCFLKRREERDVDSD